MTFHDLYDALTAALAPYTRCGPDYNRIAVRLTNRRRPTGDHRCDWYELAEAFAARRLIERGRDTTFRAIDRLGRRWAARYKIHGTL